SSLRDAKLFTTFLKQRYVRCFEIQSIYAFCLLFSWQESLFKVLYWFFHFFFVLRLTCFANFFLYFFRICIMPSMVFLFKTYYIFYWNIIQESVYKCILNH